MTKKIYLKDYADLVEALTLIRDQILEGNSLQVQTNFAPQGAEYVLIDTYKYDTSRPWKKQSLGNKD